MSALYKTVPTETVDALIALPAGTIMRASNGYLCETRLSYGACVVDGPHGWVGAEEALDLWAPLTAFVPVEG